MANNNVNKSTVKSKNDKETQRNILIRFPFLLEGMVIILTTMIILWVTRFIDVSALIMTFFPKQQDMAFSEAIIVISITTMGIFGLLSRYSLFLRKKMKLQYIAEEEIKRLAFFDRLTNLPNRDLCHNRLEHAVARADRNKTSIAVLLIGIDDFTVVNEQQGHDGGDKLLQQVAKRLSSQLRSGDTLARIAGVEFLIILETVEPKESINTFTKNLIAKLVSSYRIAMRDVYITANIGIALYPSDGEHSKELMLNAETAMRFAKEQGRNGLAFFSKELQEQANYRNKIAEQLRNAIDRNEFILHYQPIISAQSNQVIAVEALLRWNNKLLGNIDPNVFIPIAEEIGIICQISDWVLTQACWQNKTWQQQGYPSIVMAINVSLMELCINNYANTIASSLEKAQLEPKYLELEFTENILMKNAKQSLIQIRQLSALGVSIALDNFGTGYSSIQYLAKFKLNKLKIDGDLIKNITNNSGDIQATKAIIALAQQLKLHVTAEGVETVEQYEFMKSNNVDSMQGYHFSHPVEAQAFEQLLLSSSEQKNKQSIK